GPAAAVDPGRVGGHRARAGAFLDHFQQVGFEVEFGFHGPGGAHRHFAFVGAVDHARAAFPDDRGAVGARGAGQLHRRPFGVIVRAFGAAVDPRRRAGDGAARGGGAVFDDDQRVEAGEREGGGDVLRRVHRHFAFVRSVYRIAAAPDYGFRAPFGCAGQLDQRAVIEARFAAGAGSAVDPGRRAGHRPRA